MNTVKFSLRYSPNPVSEYPVPAASRFLSKDEQAWNLAWLSFDFDNYTSHKDAKFSCNVLATVRTLISSGVEDIASLYPERTVRTFLKLPAPQAVQSILGMKHLHDLPMFRHYGQEWADTILSRSKLYREAYDAELDVPVPSTNEALNLLRKFM